MLHLMLLATLKSMVFVVLWLISSHENFFTPCVMSVLKYITRQSVNSLSHPEKTLSHTILSAAIESANSKVKKVIGKGSPMRNLRGNPVSPQVSCKEGRKEKKLGLYSAE